MSSRTRAVAVALTFAALIALPVGLKRYRERERIVEGAWVYMFEGSNFIEGASIDEKCAIDFRDAAWLVLDPPIFNSASGESPNTATGTYHSEYGTWPMDAYRIKFLGRQKYSPLGVGHMGGWKHEFVVTKVIYLEPVPGVTCRNFR
jgi:hypothetical protein